LLLGVITIALLSLAANVYFVAVPSTAPSTPGDEEAATLHKETSQLRAELADMTRQVSSAAKAQAKAEAEADAAKSGAQTQTDQGTTLAAKLAAAEAALQKVETRAVKAEAATESLQKEIATLSSRVEASKQDHLTQLQAAKEATAAAEAHRATADSAATAAAAERDSLASQLAALRKELATARGAEEAARKQAGAATAAAASGATPRQWSTEMAGALETIVAAGSATLLSLKSAAFPGVGTPCTPDDTALERALQASGLPSSFPRPRLVAAGLVALLLLNAVVCVVALGRQVHRRLRPEPVVTEEVATVQAAVEAARSQAEVAAAKKLATALEEARKDKERALTEAAKRAEEDKAKAISRLVQSQEAKSRKNVPAAHQETVEAAPATAAPGKKDPVTTPAKKDSVTVTPMPTKPPSKLFAPWSEPLQGGGGGDGGGGGGGGGPGRAGGVGAAAPPKAASSEVAPSQDAGADASAPEAASGLVDSLRTMAQPLMSQVSTIQDGAKQLGAAMDPRLAARPADKPSPAAAPANKATPKKSGFGPDFTGFFLINKDSEAYQAVES